MHYVPCVPFPKSARFVLLFCSFSLSTYKVGALALFIKLRRRQHASTVSFTVSSYDHRDAGDASAFLPREKEVSVEITSLASDSRNGAATGGIATGTDAARPNAPTKTDHVNDGTGLGEDFKTTANSTAPLLVPVQRSLDLSTSDLADALSLQHENLSWTLPSLFCCFGGRKLKKKFLAVLTILYDIPAMMAFAFLPSLPWAGGKTLSWVFFPFSFSLEGGSFFMFGCHMGLVICFHFFFSRKHLQNELQQFLSDALFGMLCLPGLRSAFEMMDCVHIVTSSGSSFAHLRSHPAMQCWCGLHWLVAVLAVCLLVLTMASAVHHLAVVKQQMEGALRFDPFFDLAVMLSKSLLACVGSLLAPSFPSSILVALTFVNGSLLILSVRLQPCKGRSRNVNNLRVSGCAAGLWSTICAWATISKPCSLAPLIIFAAGLLPVMALAAYLNNRTAVLASIPSVPLYLLADPDTSRGKCSRVPCALLHLWEQRPTLAHDYFIELSPQNASQSWRTALGHLKPEVQRVARDLFFNLAMQKITLQVLGSHLQPLALEGAHIETRLLWSAGLPADLLATLVKAHLKEEWSPWLRQLDGLRVRSKGSKVPARLPMAIRRPFHAAHQRQFGLVDQKADKRVSSSVELNVNHLSALKRAEESGREDLYSQALSQIFADEKANRDRGTKFTLMPLLHHNPKTLAKMECFINDWLFDRKIKTAKDVYRPARWLHFHAFHCQANGLSSLLFSHAIGSCCCDVPKKKEEEEERKKKTKKKCECTDTHTTHSQTQHARARFLIIDVVNRLMGLQLLLRELAPFLPLASVSELDMGHPRYSWEVTKELERVMMGIAVNPAHMGLREKLSQGAQTCLRHLNSLLQVDVEDSDSSSSMTLEAFSDIQPHLNLPSTELEQNSEFTLENTSFIFDRLTVAPFTQEECGLGDECPILLEHAQEHTLRNKRKMHSRLLRCAIRQSVFKPADAMPTVALYQRLDSSCAFLLAESVLPKLFDALQHQSALIPTALGERSTLIPTALFLFGDMPSALEDRESLVERLQQMIATQHSCVKDRAFVVFCDLNASRSREASNSFVAAVKWAVKRCSLISIGLDSPMKEKDEGKFIAIS